MHGIDRRTLLTGSAAAATSVAASLATTRTNAADAKAASNPVAAKSEHFPNLFSPIEIGGIHLKSRVVHACITTRYAQDSKEFIDYNANRARGGAAMIVMDPPEQDARDVDALRKVADAVERYDCRIVAQLSKFGRGIGASGRPFIAMGASPLPDGISWTVPHVLSTAEMKQIIDDFAQTSLRVKQAGFSGVEISASHGHLIHEILSGEANHRDDEYGGDLKRRTKFVTDMMSAIRSACGRPFIIGVKLVGEDGVPGGIDLAQSKAITQILHATGELDYLTYGWGAHADTLYMHAPTRNGPRMPYLEKIVELGKKAPGVPLGAIALITEPHEGEAIIRDKQADLVMLARPFVADAAWGLKASEGRERDQKVRIVQHMLASWAAGVETSLRQ